MTRPGDLGPLVRGQLGWLQGYVRRRIGPHLRVHDDSLDFVQGALVDLLAQDKTLDISDEGSLRALLAQIVDNNVRDKHKWLRRDKRDPSREEGAASDTILGEAGTFKEITTPSKVVDRQETRDLVREALDSLDASDREVIWLHEFERLSHEAIGERLEISTDAARVRFQRALPKLALKVRELRSES